MQHSTRLVAATVTFGLVFLAMALAAAQSGTKEAPLPPIAASDSEIDPVEPGDIVRNVALTTLSGKKVYLDALLEDGPAVIVFYRGGWCPYCNAHLAELRKIEQDLSKLGLTLLAISPDNPAHGKDTKKKEEVSYTILSDAKLEAARAFGVAFKVDDETIEKYKGYGIDLVAASGEQHQSLPVPSVFIVDSKRRVVYSHANADYKVRLDNDAILRAARKAVAE